MFLSFLIIIQVSKKSCYSDKPEVKSKHAYLFYLVKHAIFPVHQEPDKIL